MTVHYSDTVAGARLQAVIDAIDAGASYGTLFIGTSALSGTTGILGTVTMVKPCGTISTPRTLTFSGTPIDSTADAAGAAAKAEIRDSDGNVIVNQLSVGVTGSGADIVMDTTNLIIGRPIRWVSGTIVHP